MAFTLARAAIGSHAERVQPPFQSQPPAGVVDLWLCQVRPHEPTDEGLLAPDERERAGRFVDSQARALFALGRSLLRAALASYLDYAPQALRLDQRCLRCGRQHGKPRLVDPVSDLAFNLAHSRGLIVLAVCGGYEVGVDVEDRGRATSMPELAPLLLSAAEHQALEDVPEASRPEVLLECWVRKEALLKATGDGLSRDPRGVALPLARGGTAVYRHDGTWWGVCSLDVGPDHAGAVAVRGSVPRVRKRTDG
jgi:4'-phosphopantetheinyl transferase